MRMNHIRVITSVAADADVRKKLKEFFEGLHGSNYETEYVVDPSIIGGIVIEDGDKVYDGSITSQLAIIRKKLL